MSWGSVFSFPHAGYLMHRVSNPKQPTVPNLSWLLSGPQGSLGEWINTIKLSQANLGQV